MNKILKNKIVVLTRSLEQSTEALDGLESLGAKVILFPTIKIVPPDSYTEFDKLAKQIDSFHYIIFSSANAVKFFHLRISQLQIGVDFNKIQVVATGEKTAKECKALGINVNLVPDEFSARGIATELSKFDMQNKNVFIPGSAIARDELKFRLKDMGAKVYYTPVYNVIQTPREDLEDSIKILNENKPQLFIFTSPSTFKNFISIMKIEVPAKYFKCSDIAVIGSTTESVLKDHDLIPAIVPAKFTMSGLIDGIVNYYSHKS